MDIDGVMEKVKIADLEIDIIYDNSKSRELELEVLTKEKDMLEKSILRRNNLLSNENYLKKAPSNIVAAEKDALTKEIARLEIIKNKLGE